MVVTSIRTSAFVLLTLTLVLPLAPLAHDRITTTVTWQSDISRIVQSRCVGCHAPGGRGPMPLRTYAEARPWARAIKEEVLTRRMPKWHAARGYGDFSNDPSLSPFEIALVAAWADGGAPERARTDKAPAVKRPDIPQKADAGDSGTGGSVVTVPCRQQSVSGTLLAVSPRLAGGQSVAIAAMLPDGRREIVAWIRDYDPEFHITYRLRSPIDLPRGSRLVIDGEAGACTVALTLGR